MAGAYNRYTGSGSVGVYKDIVDDLFYVTQNETPIFDMAKSSVARDYVHYWESTVFAAVTANSFTKADGEALSTSWTPSTKTEYSNYIEEAAIRFDVTKRAAAIASQRGYAGIKNYWTTAKFEAQTVLKDNNEFSLLNGTPASGDAVTSESKTQGLIPMATTYGTTGYEAAATFSYPTGGEAEFRTLLTNMRAAGGARGRKKMVFTSYTNKDNIGKSWLGNATEISDMVDKAQKFADIKVYVSQYGPLTIMGHDMCSSTNLVVFDAEDLYMAWLYKTQTIDLGRTGLQENVAATANAMGLEYRRPSTLGCLLTVS